MASKAYPKILVLGGGFGGMEVGLKVMSRVLAT